MGISKQEPVVCRDSTMSLIIYHFFKRPRKAEGARTDFHGMNAQLLPIGRSVYGFEQGIQQCENHNHNNKIFSKLNSLNISYLAQPQESLSYLKSVRYHYNRSEM